MMLITPTNITEPKNPKKITPLSASLTNPVGTPSLSHSLTVTHPDYDHNQDLTLSQDLRLSN